MPHISEGTLHAFLDGALPLPGMPSVEDVEQHIETCDACRDRLHEERTIRSRASSIVGEADLAVEQPPFEEISKKAGRTRVMYVKRIRRLRALAAAAVVVIVAGVGWMIRSSTSGLPAAGDIATAPAMAGDAVQAPVERSAEAVAALTDSDAVVGRAEQPARAETGVAVAADTSALAASDVTLGTAGRADEGAGADALQLEEPMAAAEAPVTEERSTRPSFAARGAAAPSAAPSSDLDAVVRDLQVAVTPLLREENKMAVTESTDRAAMARQSTRWRPADVEAATAHLGHVVPALPDHEIVDVEIGTIATHPGVRITHRLEDGTLLSLVSWPVTGMESLREAIELRANQAVGEDVRVVIAQGFDVAVMASAALPAVELEQLAREALRNR